MNKRSYKNKSFVSEIRDNNKIEKNEACEDKEIERSLYYLDQALFMFSQLQTNKSKKLKERV